MFTLPRLRERTSRLRGPDLTARVAAGHMRTVRAPLPGLRGSGSGRAAMRATMAAAISLTLACASGGGGAAPTAGSPNPGRSPLTAPDRFSILFAANGSHTSEVVAAPIERVWQLLPDAYRLVGFPGAPAEGRGGAQLFVTPHMQISGPMYPGERTSDYINCGASSTAGKRSDAHEVTFVIVTRLTPAAEGGTRITTLIDGHSRDRALGGNSVPCHGTGKMERQIADLVKRSVAGGSVTRP